MLVVVLADKDRSHLVRLRQALESDHPINREFNEFTGFGDHRDEGYVRHRLAIYSQRLAHDLTKYGIVTGKARTLPWPDVPLSDELLRHFLRGLFDADGSFGIGYNKHVGRKRGRLWFALTQSNESLLLTIQEFLVENCDLSYTKLHHDKRCDALSIHYNGNEQVARIVNFLWDGAQIFLPRKVDLARQHLDAIGCAISVPVV